MILVTGSTGFLGKAVCEQLSALGVAHFGTSLSSGVNLLDPAQTKDLFREIKPEFVINCAAYVGGIQFGYRHPAETFKNNLLMTVNLLDECHNCGVTRIVNPISNCAYPAKSKLFKEDEFWDGPLHESVLVYGFVRKASWVGAWAYAKQYRLDSINLVLSNMYGPGDHFDEERSHALGALIMKFIRAKFENHPHVDVWGSGEPVREWLHVRDGAEALIRALKCSPYSDPINVGVGEGISILDLAKIIKKLVGYEGEIKLDLSKPDGAPYKTVDGSRGASLLNWRPQIELTEGIKETIDWYLKN